MTFMIFCPARSMTPLLPSSTHTFTESSTRGHVLLVRLMDLNALARRLQPLGPRHRDLVDPHPEQRQSPMEHLAMYDGRLTVTTVTTLVGGCRPSTGLYPRPWRSRTQTLSCSRSSDISRVRQRAPCTRRGSRSYINS